MSRVVLVIDVQNDYFPGGHYPLWQSEQILEKILGIISKAKKKHIPIVLVQHVEEEEEGSIYFLQKGTAGVEIHPSILQAAPKAIKIVKSQADSFWGTELEQCLSDINGSEILMCGMMTQNTITHTALSKAADKYTIKIISDCCTSVDRIIHEMALKALSTEVILTNAKEAFNGLKEV